MEIQETLIAIIPLVLVVALLIYAARGITEGRGFKAVRETVPAAIVLLVAIAVIGAVSSAGDDGPTDEVDVPIDMMIFDTSSGTDAILIGISADYIVPAGGYELVVPTTYQGLPVTAVRGSVYDEADETYIIAYLDCIAISSESIETIQMETFRDCTSLTSASFPAATTIGEDAFGGCTSLTSASFPAATTIGRYAFYQCTSLATVSFPAATTIGESAFQMYEIASVRAVGDRIVVGSAIESVTLGPLTSVGMWAFNDWTFYDADGTTALAKTAASLANSTFQGTASALVKVGSASMGLTPDQQRAVEEITALMASMTEEERLQYEIAQLEEMQVRSESEDLEWATERLQEARSELLEISPVQPITIDPVKPDDPVKA